MTRHAHAAPNTDCSIIALDNFIQATRDSGYKNTASAISELVDNAIQACAQRIAIRVAVPAHNDGRSIEVSVLDDGCGMDKATLRQALRFGGSTRFGDRRGLGRYGMGLPNASLSQARRVTVFTWQTSHEVPDKHLPNVYTSYLDVDEIVRGEMVEVPKPQRAKAPPSDCTGVSGTLVLWSQCDRLDHRRASTIVRKLEVELGRRFRHFIWGGLRITVNGEAIDAFDPLYLHPGAEISGAQLFGDAMRFEVSADPIDTSKTGWVSVRFTELPVHAWHKFSNEEKRRIGLSKGAGVSIVRGGREVDYGWFFMGSKHRENYDDWWRCEIQFDPILDEAFGISHTKQQARPQAHLIEALAPDLEATARALNSRARKAHTEAKKKERCSEAERIANERDHLLPPLPCGTDPSEQALMRELEQAHPALRDRDDPTERYSIIEHVVKDTSFFTLVHEGDRLVLVLNPDHPFYREIYKPLSEGEAAPDQHLRAKLELLLLAAARSEATARERIPALARHRLDWSNTLAAFLNDK